MQDTGDFLKKIKHLGKKPEGAILVTADVLGFCASIPQDLGLQSLRKRVNETGICKVPTEEITTVRLYFHRRNGNQFS